MGDLVNLRRHRKKAARSAGEAKAAENRARFGVPGAERKAAAIEAERAARLLDAHRLRPAEPDDPSA